MTTSSASTDGHLANAEQSAASNKMLTDFSIDTLIKDQQQQQEAHQLDGQRQTIQSKEPADLLNETPKLSLVAADQQQQLKKFRPKNFQCPACKMAFSNNGQLKNHVRIHTGERPFRCNFGVCNKTFTRNEELTRHKLIHTGVRPHSCTACGKCFGRKDHLKKHVRTHERKKMRRKIFVPARLNSAPIGATFDLQRETFVPSAEPATQNLLNKVFSTNINSLLSQQTIAPALTPTTFALSKQHQTTSSSSRASNFVQMNLPTQASVTSSSAVPMFPSLTAQSTLTSTALTAISGSTSGAVNAIQQQQFANDCWTRWYQLIGLYQQHQQQPNSTNYRPIVDRLSNLFRKS